MLKEKHIEFLVDLLDVYLKDAESELDIAKERNDGIEEARESLDELSEIIMTLEAMREMNDSDDIEVLRAENAMLRKILKGVAGNLREIADQVSEI